MSSTRSVKSPGVFAANALTTIPPVPVSGVSYRDAVAGAANTRDGWPFAEKVNSAEFNQIMYQLSTLLSIQDTQGVLGWTDLVDYAVNAYVVGSDGRLYVSVLASGPTTTTRDPVSNPTYWSLVPAMRDFSFNSAANGTFRFPSGLIIQWGVQPSAISTTTTATFPIAFPTLALAVIACGLNVNGNFQAYVTLNSFTPSAAQFNCFNAPGGSAPTLANAANGVSIRYIAVGY